MSDQPRTFTIRPADSEAISLKLNPGDDRVWFRYEPDGSVTMVNTEPVDSERWYSLKLYDTVDAPTRTVRLGHSDGHWVDAEPDDVV